MQNTLGKNFFLAIKQLFYSLIPCKLIIVPNPGGFFSNFNKVIDHISSSLNRNGIRAIEIDWRVEKTKRNFRVHEGIKEQFSYGVCEDGNLWELFFEQLSCAKRLSFIRRVTSQYNNHGITGQSAYSVYKSGGEWRTRYHEVFKEYIRIKPHIIKRVEDFYSDKMASKHCIGVHIRNLAHKREQPKHELPSMEKYICKINNVIQKAGTSNIVIFVATEVEEAIGKLRNIFGDLVIVQPNVERAPRFSEKWNGIVHIDNKNPSAKLGEDILIDCLLLAKCNTFVHITSNIATAVGYINPSIEMIYCE